MHPDLDAFKKDILDKRFAKVLTEKPKESRSGEISVIREQLIELMSTRVE